MTLGRSLENNFLPKQPLLSGWAVIAILAVVLVLVVSVSVFVGVKLGADDKPSTDRVLICDPAAEMDIYQRYACRP